jgi:hypothetical protein
MPADWLPLIIFGGVGTILAIVLGAVGDWLMDLHERRRRKRQRDEWLVDDRGPPTPDV